MNDAIIHDSDCALHNEPAYPKGECDCSVKDRKKSNLVNPVKNPRYDEVYEKGIRDLT